MSEESVADLLAAALASQFVKKDFKSGSNEKKHHHKHKKHKKKKDKNCVKVKETNNKQKESEKSVQKHDKRNVRSKKRDVHSHKRDRKRKRASDDRLDHDSDELYPKRSRSKSSDRRNNTINATSTHSPKSTSQSANPYKVVFDTKRKEKEDELSDISVVQQMSLKHEQQQEKSPLIKEIIKPLTIDKSVRKSISINVGCKGSKLLSQSKDTEKVVKSSVIKVTSQLTENDSKETRPKEVSVDYCLVDAASKPTKVVPEVNVINHKQDNIFKMPYPVIDVSASLKQQKENNVTTKVKEQKSPIKVNQTQSDFDCLLLHALGLENGKMAEEKEDGEIDSGDEKTRKEKKAKKKEKCSKSGKDKDRKRDRLEDRIHYDDYDYDDNSKDRHSSTYSKSDKSSCSFYDKKESRYDKRDYHDDEKYYAKDEDAYVRYYEDKSAKENYYYGSYYEGSQSDNDRRSYNRSKSHYEDNHDDYYRSSRPSSYNRYHNHDSRDRLKSYSRESDRRYDDDDNYKKEKIDRKKLFAIAKENLVKMIEKGDVPKGINIDKLKLDHLRELTTQKSVQHWTEFCRAISSLESGVYNNPDLNSDNDSDDDEIKSVLSEPGLTNIKHPFNVKEKKDIEFRVKDFVQLKTRSSTEMAIELRSSFPVSSGNQHRRKESEWIEVEPIIEPPKKAKKSSESQVKKPKKVQEDMSITGKLATTVIAATEGAAPNDVSSNSTVASTSHASSAEESVFSSNTSIPIDVGSVMAQRLSAMKKLEEDPCNVVALKQMYQAQTMMREWAESKIVPGQFYGSTDANVLTGDQLNGPFVAAWTRKDQFKTATPINEGMGMYLLIKMGWIPGTGLGKNNEGNIEPLCPHIKMDKKGLIAEEEEVRNLPMQLVSVPTETGKHPSSMLHEFCMKRKYGPPIYELVYEQGPPHMKNFMFKVIVNNVEYQPSISSHNKKHARALAAGVCLQAFGLLPKDSA